MSQRNPSDGAHKGFAVGRGLLAAAETLNFSMNDRRPLLGPSSRPSHGMSSASGGGDGKNRSNTMKLFHSLGLSPADIDALAQIPEENISLETLPQLIMQLKNRKLEAGRRMGGNSRDLPPIPTEHSFRASRDWEDVPPGRMGSSGGRAHGQQMDSGYGSMQDGPSRSYRGLGESSSFEMSKDRPYTELSRDRYGGLGMGPSPASDSGFPQRRIGSPSHGKVQDFLGVMPHMFPHVCSLCDFEVHSTMDWTQHSNGPRHMENRRLLLQLYPDWDPRMAANRASGALLQDSTNCSDGLLGPAPMGLQRGGMNSNWGAATSNQRQPFSGSPKIRSRVVVAKFAGTPLTLDSLLVLAQPFGTVCEHLVLNNKAFMEMRTHEEALAMANFYQWKPAVVHGKEITIYVSQELMRIEKGNRDSGGGQSRVVFFSNLPKEREDKMELLTLARRFGTLEKYLFLTDQAFLQLGTPEDAETMVKYYTLHPLTIKGRKIQLNVCEKYKTLVVKPFRNIPTREREDTNRKGSSSSRKGSPKRRRSESSSEKSSKSKAEGSKKEKDVEPEAEGSTVLGEVSEDEISGVIEDVGDDYDESAEKQEGEPDEAMSEPGESSTQEVEPIPDIDEMQTVEEGSEVPPTAESKKTVVDKAAPAEGGVASEDLGRQESATSTEPNESTQMSTEEREEDQEMPMDEDFPEDMDEFVTLDELEEEVDPERQESLSKSGHSRSGKAWKVGERKVVNVVGFKRGRGFLQEILNLAKPFGRVVRHLVLETRPEAFLELSSEEEARSMMAFYKGNIFPKVCGKAVKIHHSQAYSTIQGGRVVYIGQIPPFRGSVSSFLKIAEPFGKVTSYFLSHVRNECFIEMETSDEAEKMVNACKENPPKFQGKWLNVEVCRKYKRLNHGIKPPSSESEEERRSKREHSSDEEDSPAKNRPKKEEEPPAKKACIREEKTTAGESNRSTKEEENKAAEEPSSDGEQQQQQDETEKETSEIPGEQEEGTAKTDNEDGEETQGNDAQKDCGREAAGALNSSESEEKPSTEAQIEKKPAPTSLPLEPYQPNIPVGVEYVKMGYYCRVCFLFYSNEDTAKKVHCSSQSHYQKLKKHLEKEKKAKEGAKPR